MRVSVVGLGKIGLPLAAHFARRGAEVTGCDINQRIVEMANNGSTLISEEPGLSSLLEEVSRAGTLRANSETSKTVASCEVVVVIVPVGVGSTGETDFGALDAAAEDIGRGLNPGTLVVLESTVPVGSTRGRFRSRLRASSGLREEDFFVAFSPERVSSGSVLRDLETYPKLVGGLSDAAGERAAGFYRRFLGGEIILLPDAETAELAKLAESAYRDLNIALANQLAMTADSAGIDYQVMAAAANSQPYSHLHSPGVGVGGHCIPVYPYFLLQAQELSLVRLGREVNDAMADYGTSKLFKALEEEGILPQEARIAILGLAYRGGVKEATLSSTLLLDGSLRARGAHVRVHDPLFSREEISHFGLEPLDLPPAENIHAVILQAGHDDYRELDWSQFRGAKALLDGRRFLQRDQVETAGLRYLAIGAR